MTAKVIDMVRYADAKKAVPIQVKLEVQQRITREWSAHLTACEVIVLTAVADRTIGWGEKEAYFTCEALIHGDTMYAALPIKRAAAFKALAGLEAKGVINRRRIKQPHQYAKVYFSVNTHWKPGTVNPAEPREGSKSGSTRQTSSSTSQTSGSTTRTLYTVSTLQVSHNDSQGRGIAPRPAMESESLLPGKKEGRPQPQTPSPRQRTRTASPAVLVREQVAQADAIRRAERADAQASPIRPGAQTTVAVIEMAWRRAIIETFPHNVLPAWGVREKSQAKTAAANWLHRNQIDLPRFVAWAATNWTAIMQKQFKWMTKSPPPAVPAWGFLISFIDHFTTCWAEGKLDEWLSDSERTEIERIMARGLTWEQAMAKHAEAKAAGALRGEMEKRELGVKIKDRVADVKLDRARKLADYAGDAPIHPRSRAALRMKREAEAAREPVVIVGEPATGDLKGFTPSELLPERNPFDGD